MTLQDSVRRTGKSGPVHTVLVWWYTNPGTRFPMLQWIVAPVVGVLLGGVVLLISSRSGLLRIALLIMITVSPFGVMIVGGAGYLRKFLLAVILMDIPFQVDINLGYNERLARFGAISGLNVSFALIGLAILYTWGLVSLLSKWTPPPARSLFRRTWPAVAYTVIVTLSVVAAKNLELAVFEINLLLQAVLLYFYVVYTTRTRKDVLFIVTMLFIGLVLFSFLAIYLSFTGGFSPGAEKSANVAVSRFGGASLGQPNVAASYLMMVLLVVFSSLTAPQVGRWYRRLAALTVGLGGIALLVTGSRGGWGGFAISIVLLCWLAWRRGWLSLKIPLAYFTLVILVILPFYESILARLSSDTANESAQARGPLNMLAVRMIRDHPLLGVGVNNFAWNLPKYVTSEFAGAWIDTVHNKYLLVWSETGILGLVTFVCFLLTTLCLGWQVWRHRDRYLASFALAFSLAIVAAMIHMTVAQYHSRVQFQLLWLMAGVVTAMFRMERNDV